MSAPKSVRNLVQALVTPTGNDSVTKLAQCAARYVGTNGPVFSQQPACSAGWSIKPHPLRTSQWSEIRGDNSARRGTRRCPVR